MSLFFRFADTNGDGTCDISANVDGSKKPKMFKLAARGNEALTVNRVIVHLSDSG